MLREFRALSVSASMRDALETLRADSTPTARSVPGLLLLEHYGLAERDERWRLTRHGEDVDARWRARGPRPAVAGPPEAVSRARGRCPVCRRVFVGADRDEIEARRCARKHVSVPLRYVGS